jgi:hypothetical protein
LSHQPIGKTMADSPIPYRHYDPNLLEPMFPQRTRKLEDLAIELATKSGQMTQGLHPIVVDALGDTDSIDELLLQ